MLRTENLDFYYAQENNDDSDKEIIIEPKDYALNGINLDVKKGEFLAVLGHNGCGKSTLAKHFNAILLPCGGDVYVKQMNTKDEELLFQIRQTAAMVFQNPDNQIVATIVEEDVAFAPENLGVEPSLIRKRVDEVLKTVGMYDFKDQAPHTLSGGQKQRLCIAGVLAMEPDCIILDEPTAMLDPIGRSEVLKTVKKLNKERGMTVILITHYMEEAAMAQRVVVMDAGKIVINDIPKKVFSQVERMKKLGLDVPQSTQLIHSLNDIGMDMDEEVLTVDECVDAILKKLGK